MNANYPGPGLTRDEYLTILRAGGETGFWDDHGRPAPWPDDFDEWSPTTTEPITPKPGQPPF
jgi:hypothetical protein